MIDKQILDKRARELARPTDMMDEAASFLKIVAFRLADEVYGIELIHVKEVHPLRNLTQLPGLPPYIKGIINVRGQIVSVLDLKNIFQLSQGAVSQTSKVIILQSRDMEFGIAADKIMEVSTVKEDTLTLSLPILKGFRADYLKGITEDRLIVLDGEKLLKDPKLVVDQRE